MAGEGFQEEEASEEDCWADTINWEAFETHYQSGQQLAGRLSFARITTHWEESSMPLEERSAQVHQDEVR